MSSGIRSLTLVVIMMAFLFSGYVCTVQRNGLNVPLDGTYNGTAASAAQSLKGLPVTVAATSIGYEILFPASGEPIYGWVDTQKDSASQNAVELMKGEGAHALAYAGGAGMYAQGSEALIGGSTAHELHWLRITQHQDADGNPANDGYNESHSCVYLVGAAYGEDFFPLLSGCTA